MLIQDVVSISKAQLRIESKIQHPRQGRDAYLPINHCIPLDQKKIAGLYTSLVRECISLLDVQI